MAVQLFVMIATLAPGILAPAATAALGVAPQTVGVYYAIQNLGAMIGCLALVSLVRRYGGIRASQVGTLLVGGGAALCASGLVPAMAVSAVMTGLGMSLLTPASAVLLARATPPERMNLVFSIRQSVVPVGVAAAGVLVPWLLDLAGWQATLVLVGSAGLAFALAIQSLRASADAERERNANPIQLNLLEPLKTAFGTRALRYVALGGFVFNGSQQVLWVYVVTYLHFELGYSIAAAGLVFSASQLSSIVLRIAWGWLADRLGDPFVVLTGLAAGSSVFFAVFAAVGPQWPFWLVVLAALGFSGTVAAWNGVHVAAIVRFAPRERLSTATGAVQLFAFFGAVLAPALFALTVSVLGGYGRAFLCFALLPLAFFALMASGARRRSLTASA
jgi:MFS family permease